jgi:hypothetical protein
MACLIAAVEESKRAAYRGPLLLRFFPAILFLTHQDAFFVDGG